MKNLIIFVLALIALSSVSSVKLNKVLKEEKVLSVSIPNEKVELKSETLTDDAATRDKGKRKIEESLVSNNVKPGDRGNSDRRKVEEGTLNKLEKVEKVEKSLQLASCGELSDVLKALEGSAGYDAVNELFIKSNC